MEGLSTKEVQERIKNNLVNKKVNYSRSILDIILRNVCTLFNFINLILFILVLTTGSYHNSLFAGVIIINTVISIVGEIKAKIIVDKLNLTFSDTVNVIRDGITKEISLYEVVYDDVLILKSGDTVPLDVIVLNSNMCEVDESIITGEDKSIIKRKNDKIISGSIIISGSVKAKVVSISKNSYATSLIKEANTLDRNETYLQKSLNKILYIIMILIVPIMLLLFITSYVVNKSTYNEAILYTTAGIIGMIPSGLILLSSIALSKSVINLASKRVIVQRLNGIEALASVDILCLDKTGTITDGSLEVIKVINKSDKDISNIISNMVVNNVYNQTDLAMNRYFKLTSKLDIIKYVPFSSYRKYSMISIKNMGTYAMGALEYMIKNKKYDKEVYKYIDMGYRVVTLVYSPKYSKNQSLPSDIKIIGYIILKDNIRNNVSTTLKYFESQGVNLKILSGDAPTTVLNIMKQVSNKNLKCLDCSNISSLELASSVREYDIFARCNPYQKKLIISNLKKYNTIGMIGDGVNDILALKEADCSISLTSNSNASRSVSQIVLLDNDFDSLPSIVNEGRGVINNIERVSSLYLIKTIYSSLLSVLCIFLGWDYPFYPIQLTLISSICVGLPSLFLTFIKDYRKVSRDFIRISFKTAVSGGITCVINVLLLMYVNSITHIDYQIILVGITGFVNLYTLYRKCIPFNFYKALILGGSLLMFVSIMILLKDLFYLGNFNFNMLIILMIFSILDILMIYIIEKIYVKLFYKDGEVWIK